ncbi:MerR family DNA-binding protein [Kordiimonas lacus]|nr:MerR family DNA-binding protein [Kordiimonas lacus]
MDHLKRLKFIRRTRDLGFTNQEVKGLLEMVDGTYACDDVKGMALANVKLVKNKVADLVKLQAALESMAAECRGGDTPNCVIIDRLLDE